MAEGTGPAGQGWSLTGGSEMGDLMRSIDWAGSPLGPMDQWPQSLRTVLSILFTSRHPIFVWWGKDLVQFYNDAYRPILGETKHPRAMGQRGRECWAEIWDVIAPMIEGVMERGESTFTEDGLLVLDRNGFLEECFFTYGYSPIRDESQGIGGVFVACTETTKRVHSERRLRILSDLGTRIAEQKTVAEACETTLEVLSSDRHDFPFALIYQFDEGSGLAHLQGALGLEAGSEAASSSISIVGENDGKTWPLGDLASGGRARLVRLDSPLSTYSGGPWQEPPLSALCLPLGNAGSGKPLGALIVGLSPRLKLEGEYRQFLDLAAGQVTASLSAINAFNEEKKRSAALAALDRAKTDFFSNVSHEFRTPLTLILGPVEDILGDPEHPLPGPQRERALVIQRNSLRLMGLVNNLLDFSRIEVGRIKANYSPVDLARTTRELASLFQSAMEKAGLDFNLEFPPLPEPAYVDPEMWERIVVNLLSNAFKYTPSGSVSASLRSVGDHFEFEVRDTGIGIPKEDLPVLFERFHRVRETSSAVQEGSGIGLAMVQEFVKLHHGTVSVESVLGKGTRFLVSIPAGHAHLPEDQIAPPGNRRDSDLRLDQILGRKPEAGYPEPETGSAPPPLPFPVKSISNRPIRILVADDNEDMRAYLVRLLSPHWKVDTVRDGLEAVESIRKEPPDLVVSDVMMPRLDGFGILKEIRSNPDTAHIPILLLSARAGEEATLEGIESGADDYMVKPFSSRELLVRVAARLEIAELRALERAAHTEAEEQRLRLYSLFMDAPAPICILRGPELVFEFANPSFLRLYNGKEVVGKRVIELTPDIDQSTLDHLDNAFRGTPYYGIEYPFKFDWGRGKLEEKFFTLTYQPMRQLGEEPGGVVVYAFEVTAQVRARKAAEAAERNAHRFLTLVEQSSDFIALGSIQGKISFVNEAGRAMIGMDGSDDGEWTFGKLIVPGDGDGHEAEAKRILGRIQNSESWEGEIGFHHAKGGKAIPVWCNIFPLKSTATDDSADLAIVARDLSQLRETEDRLRHAQKMEAIGKLAGGIAHDFNNLLTAINGYSELCLGIAEEATLQGYLTEIRKAGERAANLTRQMLAYSRKQVLQPKVLNLNDTIRGIWNILDRTIGETIELIAGLDPDLGMVHVDPGQVEQIIFNLVINARDAMPSGGRLEIRTSNKILGPDLAEGLELPSGSYIMLSVTDTGIGMSKEVLTRAFEPFFTTKEVGKGTGLGLSSVYGIVKQSGGSITVSSEEGKGTSFRIFLPHFATPDAVEGASGLSKKSQLAGRGESIMLVEDEDAVRGFVRTILEKNGYRVFAAQSGMEAIQMAESASLEVDLLLSDVVMPGMNGPTVAEVFRRIRLETKVLFISGYSTEQHLKNCDLEAGSNLLQKPFTPDQLLERIRSVLRHSGQPIEVIGR